MSLRLRSAPKGKTAWSEKRAFRPCRTARVATWKARSPLPLELVVVDRRGLLDRDLGHRVREVDLAVGVPP